MYPRHAAFIEGAEDFAASFFNISAPEADGPDDPRGCDIAMSHWVIPSSLDTMFTTLPGAGNGPAAKTGA